MADMEMQCMQNVESFRNCLKTSLQKASAIACALHESELETAFGHTISMQKCSFVNIGDHIDSALCCASAVLRVFEAVRQIENSLLHDIDPSSDLFAYVSDTKKLEEALKFLTNNCRLAVEWFKDVLLLLQDKAITNVNENYLLNVKKSLTILHELLVIEEGSRLNGGLLCRAFDKLEVEFHGLLAANTTPFLPLVSSIGHQPFPDPVIVKLQTIVERLNANDRLGKCKSMYVEVRGTNAQTSIKTLDFGYLEILIAELDNRPSYIDQWGLHLKLVVKHVLKFEYKLCSNVFEKIGKEAWIGCFAKIAIESGILSLLQFGRNVCNTKNNPNKLLKLLDIFKVLNCLRLNFNQLFGAKGCEEIRTVTKDLIDEVVNGASKIFWQLPAQVKSLRPDSPPTDGSVPSVVSFVTGYCNQLLGDAYRPHLTQVLEIHHSWRNQVYEEGIVFTQVYNIMKEIAINLDTWSKSYADVNLSYIFMMNNHCHFSNLSGTALGDVMGDSWLRAHEQYKDYYASLYLRNSWENILPILIVKRVTNKDLVHKLKAFNRAFDERYKKESNWVITDEKLRENICKHLVEGIVQTYRVYIKNYSLLIENDARATKHIKYSVQSLEGIIGSLFQPKLNKYVK
ncbi:hypothetical protein Lal_00017529 [Lupinus albus]|uniref:Exocyst subunit Exo70 family protein n=1 Tax=Lupinus albus TaxID=3870 RepID=A0A6A4QQR1_LUPAL|nr:putative exocyst complex component Exo70, cullin repeat-like-containing domain-containing protein [Lupinus albus]KAF1869951.1 hypothetical protein Lal_00017529 [Lupinus albus]